MQLKTIQQLNQLNLDFYQQFTESFNQSRGYYWQGWKKTLPFIKQGVLNHQLSIADIGCGTGRFGSFLLDNLVNVQIEYLGLDNSSHILQLARQRFAKISGNSFSAHWVNADVVTSLLNNQQLLSSQKKIDLIVMMGVLHHIPSFHLRQKLVTQLLSHLNPSGRLILTLWRFTQFDRLKRKIVNPKIVGIEPQELEINDFILDWKKSGTAYRYCHYTDQAEIEQLLSSKAKIEHTFLSDAKEQQVNQYVIIRV